MRAKNALQNVYSMTIVNEDRTDGKALVTVKCEVQHEMDKHRELEELCSFPAG